MTLLDQASRLRSLVARESGPRSAGRAVHVDRSDSGSHGRGVVAAVCSGKGGVGKTTFAVNAAVVLAREGVRVVLVDLDVGVANADVLLGATPSRRLTRRDLLDGSVYGAMVRTKFGFDLVPGISGGHTAARLSSSELDGAMVAIDALRAHADVVLLDTGAGVGVESVALAATADVSVVVTTPEPASIADAYAAHKCVAFARTTPGEAVRASSYLVVNNASGAHDAASAAARLDATSRRFLGGPMPSLGWIAQDRRVSRSARSRVPVAVAAPMCRASRGIVSCAHAVWSVCLGVCADKPPAAAEVGVSAGR
ncbi:MAG: P-loop NTPase [Planctomycetota bacterium]